MKFIQISIEVTEEHQEILIGLLSYLDATGFEQTETHLHAYFTENNFAAYEVNETLKHFSFQTQTVRIKIGIKNGKAIFSP